MGSKTIAGYFASWKVYSTCKIEDIDPSLLTILMYAFAGVNNDGSIKVLDHWADIDLGGYKKFTQLKTKKPNNLKTLLAIGGWNVGSTVFSDMVGSGGTRKAFVESAVGFIREYGFDGIDIDWEYPAKRGGKSEDKTNFSMLLKEVRQEFDKFGYILTVAVVAGEANIDSSYEVPELSKYAHHINVMTYDMHSYSQGNVTGENAPLYSNDSLNVQNCIKAWLAKGAPANKVILGVGSYGHSYTLANASQNGIGAPATGPGLPGPRSQAAGTLSYDEILEKLKNGWKREWSQAQQVPYAYSGNQWVGYDDTESIKKKVEFSKQYNLGGIMMWSIDTDDPHGLFGSRFPLLNTIKSTL